MVLTMFKMQVILFSLIVFLIGVSTAAMAQAPRPPKGDSWVCDAVKMPFKQIPLHGQIDGIDFKPVVAELTFMRSGGASGRKPDGVEKISFKDGSGRQIDVTVYNTNKFEDVIYNQTVVSRANSVFNIGVVIDLRNLSQDDFGIRLLLGKFSAANSQPVYVVFRLDRNNWLEGCIYVQLHEHMII